MREQGSVVEVTERYAGSPIAADAAIGATSLSVVNAGDFDETGGELSVGGVAYLYTAVDYELDIITLDPVTPLVAAVTVEDTVTLVPAAPDRRALVSLPVGGDSIDARIPHALSSMLETGIRAPDEQESVVIESTGTTWSVVDVIGRPATVQGEAVDVSTLAPVENVSPDYSYPGTISMTQVDGGVIASVFATPDSSTGKMQMGYNGLQSLRADGSARLDVPNSDDRAINIDAEIVARDFTSLGGFALRGTNNEIAKDAVFTLQRGTTQPVTPPSVSIGWNYIAVEDALGLADKWHGITRVSASEWYRAFYLRPVSPTVSGGIIERFNAAGDVTDNFPVTVDPLGGVAHLGGNLYVLGKRVTGQYGQTVRWYVEIYNTSGVKQGEWLYSSTDLANLPSIFSNGTNLYGGHCHADGRFRWQERNISTGAGVGAVGAVLTAYGQDTAGFAIGSFDFGANRLAWVPRVPGATVRLFDPATGNEALSEQFPAAAGVKPVGLAWDGTAFRSLGAGPARLYTYTGIRGTATPWWVGNSWRRADATGPDFAEFETKLGSPRKFTMTRRAALIVNTAPIPSGAGGPTAADSVSLYFGTGASQPTNGNFFRRATPGAGVTSVEFTSMDFTGGSPPTAGNFPDATPAMIASDDPTILTISGDGTVTAPKKMQCGFATVSLSASASASVTVTFPVPFAVAPSVVASAFGTSVYFATVNSATATSAILTVRHHSNTASTVNIPVSWIAMVP